MGESNPGFLKKSFWFLYNRLFKINDTPQRISLGFGVGVFLGIIPGTGPVAALAAALIFRLNRASALLGSLLTNTWLSIATFLLSIKVGSAVMRVEGQQLQGDWLLFLKGFNWANLLKVSVLKIILPVIIGYIIVAFCIGFLAYLITLIIFTQGRRKNKKLNKNTVIVAVLLTALFFGFYYAHKHRALKRNYADFHCFYTTGKRVIEGENIYIIRDKTTAEFRYAPIFAVLMSGFALMDEGSADSIWFIINFCLLILSFALFKKLIIKGELDFKARLFIYGLTIAGVSRFITHNLDSGQSNILMLSGIIAGLYYISQKREGRGAAFLAFSVMIKYTPLVFIPYFIAKRKLKLSLMTLGFIVIYLLLPSIVIGIKTNFLYVKNLLPFLSNSTILDRITILDPKNQSLYSLVHRLFTKCVAYFYAPVMPFESLKLGVPAINFIFLILSVMVYSAILLKPRKAHPEQNQRFYFNIDCALLVICAVLFNLNSWMSNYIFLSMAHFIIVYYLIRRRFKDRAVFVLWAMSCVLNIFVKDSILGETLAYKLHFYSPFTVSALLTFTALLKIKFSRSSLQDYA